MLDIKLIRDNPRKVKDACIKKNIDGEIVEQILDLDIRRRSLMTTLENLRAKQNRFTKDDIEGAKKNKLEIKAMEPDLKEVEEKLQALMYQLPNIPMDGVPVGKDENENVVLRKVGKVPAFNFQPKDHVELGELLDLIDNQTASNVAGARFTYLKNELALLQFALVSYAFSVLTSPKIMKKIADSVKRGFHAKVFSPVIVPVMIKPDVFQKMARLEPKEERYHIPSDDLYLIGSAEHTLGPLHMDEVISEDRLPLRYVGYSSSFRREAGSYGKDTKGILRMHQFDKVEMETFSRPEDSVSEQDFLVAIQEYLFNSLKIPYQVVAVCTGDMGGPDARQIDIECWMPGQNRYRETNSADLNTDFQSRRLNSRFKRKNGELEFVHMNDATVFAIGRTLIAILENYQQKDGSVKIPAVLQKYAGFTVIKPKKK
jgi:seryl-tRNA synthetase